MTRYKLVDPDDYHFIINMVEQADAKFRRHRKHHADAFLINTTISEMYQSELKYFMQDFFVEPTVIQFGNEPDTVKTINIRARYDAEKERIFNKVKEQIRLGFLEFKAAALEVERQTATRTATTIDRERALEESYHTKRSFLKSYYKRVIHSMSMRCPHYSVFLGDEIRHMADQPGMIIFFLDGEPRAAAYVVKMRTAAESLREQHGSGYNVAYFATKTLTKNEEKWLIRKIKTRTGTS